MYKYWSRVLNFYYKLMGYDVVYRYMPTKEAVRHQDYINNRFNSDGNFLYYDSLMHTNEPSPPTVGEIGIWVPFRTKRLKNKIKYLRDDNAQQPKYKVKQESKDAYRAKIREHIKAAIDESKTIH